MTRVSTLPAAAESKASAANDSVIAKTVPRTFGNSGVTAAELIAHQEALLPIAADPMLRIDTRASPAISFEGKQ